ncbi:ABC transporter substrate-binding protein [Kutzneria sp. 744]|uniref:ABC transporter substrate-binding protein n=1 Tax=Kutzneria sp. (strain 744) TaxID=345341 RepID=UPI0003EEB31E|nr:multiple sugar transporter substrate-binding protein [Kutzneria sp. 744]
MTTDRLRTAAALALATGLTLGMTAACSGGADQQAGGPVTITIDGQPPQTQPFDRKIFDADVAAFEKAHPDIKVTAHEGFMDPKTFSAKLAGGQLEDVFYVYFTDPANLIARHQAADITDYVKDVPHVNDIQPALLDVFKDAGGKVYGLPTANYSMGLLYNRALFTKAGLDPDKPPTTWDEVRADAKKITALGNNTVGFADYSASGQGGWHFTTEMYAGGGDIAKKDGSTWKADFDNATGKKVLQTLHDMRWTDNSMGSKQLLQIADVQGMMGAGQLGMYLAAPDNIPTLVNQFKGNYADYGLGAMPGGKGTLIGGEGYMINPKATPAQIKAGLTWIQWKYLNPERVESEVLSTYKAQGQPVGLPVPPVPDLWTGSVRDQLEQAKEKNATVPVSNYKPYLDGGQSLKGSLEPPSAQQLYTILDTLMSTVLTQQDANIDQLLSDASQKANSVLAQVK